MTAGQIGVANCLVYARGFRISGDVGAESSDRVVDSRLIQQVVAEVVESTLRRCCRISVADLMILREGRVDALRSQKSGDTRTSGEIRRVVQRIVEQGETGMAAGDQRGNFTRDAQPIAAVGEINEPALTRNVHECECSERGI